MTSQFLSDNTKYYSVFLVNFNRLTNLPNGKQGAQTTTIWGFDNGGKDAIIET